MRILSHVIESMINEIPSEEIHLIEELKRVSFDSSYTAPEAMRPYWFEVSGLLSRYFGAKPNKPWQEKVVKIFEDKI